ncbi:class I SAM-dependent methyltransferase [Phenylobacterium sp.]|jgi:SAM-dependent methyltransferase|uniref:class I SAM-dependent methyltransferase n=1 Tax=Phenylobacterium sp. TaxID=1871053 RepID=UPI0025D781A3|nr:class I SAM-dependent methyltransferase [Phenylobacterium sp.]MCA3585773.1 class I SAM-dependent methyltransferase [Methylocystis sp.]MCA6286849.1 class I SAM-dependent methyltransferase [Phenylobacterium sp.]MCA6346217.1 class I SAM-dependent methyltransferase [Phenylobacterium sp.]MCA6349530.1 class I SAM-dependent methyltransferase [Phenylobacterium sp.]MCA6351230.1 class I SAM-dependent methyltransferase [Phenylobacterium sp.]
MDGSPDLKNAGPAQSYSGPPDYRVVGRHGVFPETSHDEIARFNFLAHMNRHLSTRIMPAVKTAWERRAGPAFETRESRAPKDRHEVRKALLQDPYYQAWSALRRATMEQRQQAGRWIALRQAEILSAKVDGLTKAGDRLELDPALPIPRYVSAVDHHCMPGSYHREVFPGDVSGAANYDSGIFATTGGALGRFSDGGGHAVVKWVRKTLPDFRPHRILDIGANLGQNVLPIAQAFPDAEVIALDVGAPMLRYGAARAKSLGVENVRFVQGDGSDLSRWANGSFDWVQTTMTLHELSLTSIKAIFAETFRVLSHGGIVLHVEQPQYAADMPLFEQAMRDWDAFYNNEPFWSTMHELDLDGFMVEAGFDRAKLIHDGVTAVVDKDVFPDAADDEGEDYGRKAAWHVIGAVK